MPVSETQEERVCEVQKAWTVIHVRIEKIDSWEDAVRILFAESLEKVEEVPIFKSQVESLQEQVERLQDKVKDEARLKEAAIGQVASLRGEVKERGTKIIAL